MELTNKVHYLLTEYRTTVQPQILVITQYINLINELANEVIDVSWVGLDEAERIVLHAEALADRTAMLRPLIAKVKVLGQQLADKATKLVIDREDHVADMSSNVDDDADLSRLLAETQALASTILGMQGIIPGGGAGAAIVIGKNAPVLADLGIAQEAKAEQIAQAATEIPQLVVAGTEIAQFLADLTTLPDI